MTRTVSGEKYLTASLVIPLVNEIISVYNSFSNQPFLKCMKNVKQFNKLLDERFGKLENNNTLFIVLLLDPCFKQIAFKDENNAEIARKNVISLVAEKMSVQQCIDRDNRENETPKIPSDPDNVDSDDEIWAEFDEIAAEDKPIIATSTSKTTVEVQRFLIYERPQRKENPLKW